MPPVVNSHLERALISCLDRSCFEPYNIDLLCCFVDGGRLPYHSTVTFGLRGLYPFLIHILLTWGFGMSAASFSSLSRENGRKA